MKVIALFVLLFSYSLSSSSQISKGDWLLGGNASFSSIKLGDDFSERKTTLFQATGNAGYFFTEKFVVGLRPSFLVEHNKSETGNFGSAVSAIGPFVRYYFLPAEERVNLLFETGYLYGNTKAKYQEGYHSNTFFFGGGPVIFLNTSVGLELLVNYSSTTVNNTANNKRNVFQVGLGLQFHLEKE